MGDFIKELNIIDFLGLLLPGSFFTTDGKLHTNAQTYRTGIYSSGYNLFDCWRIRGRIAFT